MPSGAKKRKAAKKKVKEVINLDFQGDDDPREYGEKESGGGENESFERVNGNVDSVAFEEKSGIQIDQETKLKDDSKFNNVTIEHVEFDKKSDSSSSSSSDDESKFVDKKVEVIFWEESIEYDPNLPTKDVSAIDLGKIADLSSHNIPLVEPVILSKEEVHLDEDIGSKSKMDIVTTTVNDDGEATSAEIVEKDESRNLPQSSVPVVDIVNGGQHNKDDDIESLDKKTSVALPAQPMQTTSSMGCCGLFELFKGSKR